MKEDGSVDEVGLLLSGDPTAELTLENEAVRRVVSALKTPKGSFTVNLTSSRPDAFIYLRAYVRYNGTETVYSSPAAESFSEKE